MGTGMRFGEIGALWVGDVDLRRGTVRVNKAWKHDGEDGAADTPGWLAKQVRPKHVMLDPVWGWRVPSQFPSRAMKLACHHSGHC